MGRVGLTPSCLGPSKDPLSLPCLGSTHGWGDDVEWGASGEEQEGLFRTHDFLEPSPHSSCAPLSVPLLPVARPLLVLITNQAGLT